MKKVLDVLLLHGWGFSAGVWDDLAGSATDEVLAAGRRLAAALPDARFSLLRACAHAPFLSQPARVARELREFFDE